MTNEIGDDPNSFIIAFSEPLASLKRIEELKRGVQGLQLR
jgi:hypothetical protein